MKKMFPLKSRAFSLVEVMIAVAIIALLAAVALPNILTARIGANESATQTTLKSFASACESYRTLNFAYPASISYLTGASPPYFPYDLSTFGASNPKNGYRYTPTLTNAGYTVISVPISSSTGGWDYRVTRGAILERSEPGAASWDTF